MGGMLGLSDFQFSGVNMSGESLKGTGRGWLRKVPYVLFWSPHAHTVANNCTQVHISSHTHTHRHIQIHKQINLSEPLSLLSWALTPLMEGFLVILPQGSLVAVQMVSSSYSLPLFPVGPSSIVSTLYLLCPSFFFLYTHTHKIEQKHI